MHSQIPEPLRALVEQLARLPGLGPKSAMRVAMTLLKWPEAETRRLGKGIHDLRDNLHLCSRCGGLSATDPCDICKDENRSRDTLCLVNEWDSMLTLDEGGFYHGQYMILGGLLAPLANMDSDSLDLDRLISRLEEGEIHELILTYPDTGLLHLGYDIPFGDEILPGGLVDGLLDGLAVKFQGGLQGNVRRGGAAP